MMIRRFRRWKCALGVGVLLLAAAACSRGGEPPPPRAPRVEPASPRLALIGELTEAERKYGIAPRPDPSVTYQPDVILVGGGAEAIRGVSANGLEWIIDGRAARAAELQPGRIMFLTGRAVGRVLRVSEQEGGTLAVMLGPVDLPDIVRDCDLAIEQAIDFTQSLEYAAPEFPGTISPVKPIGLVLPDRPSLAPGTYRRAVWTGPAGGYVRTAANGIVLDRFTVYPISASDGIGVEIVSTQGVKVKGRVKLFLNRPRIRFHVAIKDGKYLRAEFVISGAAGLRSEFESLSETGASGNFNERFDVPLDLSLPFIGGPLPIAVTVRQAFIMQTAFAAKGTLRAAGDYTFTGELRVGWRDNKFSIGGPTGLTTRESLLESVQGVSLGTSGLVLTHQVKVIAGIGGFGFVAGPYTGLTSSVAVSRHSDLDTLARCIGATLNIRLIAGVGYAVPSVVAGAINFFLRQLKLPEIRDNGGVGGESEPIVSAHSVKPNSPACTQ